MKSKTLLFAFLMVAMMLSACGNAGGPNATITPIASPGATLTASPETTENATGGPTTSPGADANTTASIVNNADAFKQAISSNGTWIICLLNDLTINEDLILDGEYKNGKKDTAGNDIIQRKIALYTQDENRKVTARFTLTAPKLTINSPEARIQSGTFKGDVYVNAKNFQLVDATVEGNVYFTSDEYKNSFTMDTASKVTGVKELKK